MKNKELKIGVIFIIILSILILGINYLKGLNFFNKSKVFYAKYENIDGLLKGAPITINGFQIGVVGDIDLLVNDKQKLLVKLNITKDIEIPSNSVSRIINRDLMGTKGIVLLLGNSKLIANNYDTLNSSIESSLQEEVNSQILPLKNKAEQLIGSMDSLMVIITAVLNKETRQNLTNSFKSLDKTFLLMSQTMENVDQVITDNNVRITNIITNLQSIINNIEDNNGEIKNILVNMSNVSNTFSKIDFNNTFNNIDELLENINNKKGNVGKLLNDDKIYNNLLQSTDELSELIKDIKENPSRYMNFSLIGGKKPFKAK